MSSKTSGLKLVQSKLDNIVSIMYSKHKKDATQAKDQVVSRTFTTRAGKKSDVERANGMTATETAQSVATPVTSRLEKKRDRNAVSPLNEEDENKKQHLEDSDESPNDSLGFTDEDSINSPEKSGTPDNLENPNENRGHKPDQLGEGNSTDKPQADTGESASVKERQYVTNNGIKKDSSQSQGNPSLTSEGAHSASEAAEKKAV